MKYNINLLNNTSAIIPIPDAIAKARLTSIERDSAVTAPKKVETENNTIPMF